MGVRLDPALGFGFTALAAGWLAVAMSAMFSPAATTHVSGAPGLYHQVHGTSVLISRRQLGIVLHAHWARSRLHADVGMCMGKLYRQHARKNASPDKLEVMLTISATGARNTSHACCVARPFLVPSHDVHEQVSSF